MENELNERMLFNLDRTIHFDHDLKKEDYLRVASSVDSSTNLNKNVISSFR